METFEESIADMPVLIVEAIMGLRERAMELERKLAEQQMFIQSCTENPESGDQFFNKKLLGEVWQCEELNKLLAAAKEEGRREAVPEGWQVVPKKPNSAMLDEIHLVDDFTYSALTARYKAMLAAAPKPQGE